MGASDVQRTKTSSETVRQGRVDLPTAGSSPNDLGLGLRVVIADLPQRSAFTGDWNLAVSLAPLQRSLHSDKKSQIGYEDTIVGIVMTRQPIC